MNLIQRIEAGLADLDLTVLPAEVSVRLAAYLELLAKWNRTYNLTAIRDIHEMVSQHLLDSLTILPYLQKSALAGRHIETLADVGSGAGLPGIPLALVWPELHVTLIEAVDKKSAFQRQAKAELGLTNVTVRNARVETLASGGFDAVVSRAFAKLSDFVSLAGHLVNGDGRLYAMKGVMPDQEIECLPTSWRVDEVKPLSIHDLSAQRHLIVLKKT